MIRVKPSIEPPSFDESVRIPGHLFLNRHPGMSPYPFRNVCRNDLYEAYHGYCAYTTFRINSRNDAVVDHFKPKSLYPELCCEWSNYRLSPFHIYSVKKDSDEIIDPFLLPEHAFSMKEDMQIEAHRAAFSAPHEYELAVLTIQHLKLNSPELIEDRSRMLPEALACIVDSDERDRDTIEAYAASALRSQYLFLYREAVCLGFFSR